MITQLKEIAEQHVTLYNRIQAFSLDQPDTPLSFSKKLAQENRWPLGYAQRVIEEYKKFTFLAVAAEHPVAPSDSVDQVWHLHLIYSRSYWQEFCPQVLQTPLHHEPSCGGLSEKLKLDNWYCKTLESYQRFFGELPPLDIWPTPEERFGRDLHFVRVNTQLNWLLPKPSLKSLPNIQYNQVVTFPLLLAVSTIVTGCQFVSYTSNPLNLTGPDFLSFYLLASGLVIFLVFQLRTYMKGTGRGRTQVVSLDDYEIAYLAAGKNRAVDTAIAALVQKEYVTVQTRERTLTLKKPAQDLSHPVEREVAHAIAADGSIDRVRKSMMHAIDAIPERLDQMDLLLSISQSVKGKAYTALLFAGLLALGIAKISIGISRGEPVEFLILMCTVVLVISVIFCCIPYDRSHYGDLTLKNLRDKTCLHKSRPYYDVDPQLITACALFGTVVLSGGTLGGLGQILAPVETSGGGDGGGGGCGGCGGG